MKVRVDGKSKQQLASDLADGYKIIRSFNIHVHREEYGSLGQDYVNVQKELERIKKDIKYVKWKIEHGKEAIAQWKNRKVLTLEEMQEKNYRAIAEMLKPGPKIVRELSEEERQERNNKADFDTYQFRMIRESDDGNGDYAAELARLEEKWKELKARENELYILTGRVVPGRFTSEL